MSGSMMLLKIHTGKDTWQSGKISCAQAFLDLHYRNIGRQQTSLSSQHHTMSQDLTNQSQVCAINFLFVKFDHGDTTSADVNW